MRRVLFVFLALLFCLCGCRSRSQIIKDSDLSVTETEITIFPETENIEEMETEEVTIQEETLAQHPTVPVYEYQDTDFVAVLDFIPDACVDLKYAQADNFTGHVIYDFDDVYLRYGSVKKLMAVQEELSVMGLGIKIWDGFRPVAAQFKLWDICPNDTYVANPNVGFSNHSRGFAVDLTLVDAHGNELPMPTAFDDFSGKADRNYSDCDPQAAQNAILLQNLMEKHGFAGYYGEWWHFNDATRYEVEHCFDPAMIAPMYAFCDVFVSLHKEPDAESEVVNWIANEEKFTRLGESGEYYMVDYQGQRGYVLSKFTRPVD